MDTARELSSRLLDLLRREQIAMADFLVALADFDRRKAWRDLGHSSLFYFLHRELGLSAGPAHYRKTAAELIQRFPEIVDPLRNGRLCLTSIVELSKVMTPANRSDVLPRFFHASKQQAKAVAAEIAPAAVVPRREVITAVTPGAAERRAAVVSSATQLPSPAPSGPKAFLLEETTVSAPLPVPAPATPALSAPPLPPPAPRTSAEPLTAELRRLHVTVSRRFLEKLDAARDALSHSHPCADAEAILEAGLDLVIERQAKRKGIVARPRSLSPTLSPAHAGARDISPSANSSRIPATDAAERGQPLPSNEKRSRLIPAAVRREVWVRDGGRCRWPLAGGGVCGSTHQLEFDHVVPVARGGEATVAGVRLLCRYHNDLAARQAFGDGWMDRFRRKDGAPLPARPSVE